MSAAACARRGEAVGDGLAGQVDGVLPVAGHPPSPDAGHLLEGEGDRLVTAPQDLGRRDGALGEIDAQALDQLASFIRSGLSRDSLRLIQTYDLGKRVSWRELR